MVYKRQLKNSTNNRRVIETAVTRDSDAGSRLGVRVIATAIRVRLRHQATQHGIGSNVSLHYRLVFSAGLQCSTVSARV